MSEDICRCCVFYADSMSNRVDDMGTLSTAHRTKFFITNECCMAINNIDYVRQSLQPFVDEFKMDDIITHLGESISPIEAQRCKETLQNVVKNFIDTIRNKIIDILEKVVKKMIPSISQLLLKGAKLLHQDSNSMNGVMLYLEENLDMLHTNLNQDNFTRTLDIIWVQLSQSLYDLVQENLEKSRPPSFYSNLHEALKIMVASFKIDNNDSSSNETLRKVEDLLKLHGFKTSELIQQLFLERWEEQQNLTQAPLGILSVRALFTDSSIKIEVINARNLLPMNPNGSIDSYVRINLLPEDLFAGTIRPKTQTHNKNLFPLYDEVFTIILTPEQRKCPDGLIVFNMKDKEMFGMSNEYVAEAFLHFKEVPSPTTDLESLPQVHLKLSRTTEFDGDTFKSLENRQDDKTAKEFLKKYRRKISGPHSLSMKRLSKKFK